ncbi:MAG: hypothetical protein ACT4OU_12960 [Hyphomicrobium sp.]
MLIVQIGAAAGTPRRASALTLEVQALEADMVEISASPTMKSRLKKIETQLASNRAALVGRGRIAPEDIATISDFEHRVRLLQSALAGETEIEALPTGSDPSEFEAMSLELALTEWMRDLDGRFKAPGKRAASVSM